MCNLTELFTDIANAIREKKGTSDKLLASSFPSEIQNLSVGSGDVKQFTSVEEMNEGDKELGSLAVVYGEKLKVFTIDTQAQNLVFPQSVGLTEAATDYISCQFGSKLPSDGNDDYLWIEMNKNYCMIRYCTASERALGGEPHEVTYSSTDGINYDKDGDTDFIFDYPIFVLDKEYWNEAFGAFLCVKEKEYGGLYECKEVDGTLQYTEIETGNIKLKDGEKAVVIGKVDVPSKVITIEMGDGVFGKGLEHDLQLYGESIQDGTPTPDTPVEIQSVSGKNIFDGVLELGLINGNTGENLSNSSFIRSKNYIPVQELTDYKFSTDNSSLADVLIYEYKADYTYNLTSNKHILLSKYLTTNKDTKYIRFRSNDSFTNTNIKIQIEKGTEATDYIPYNCIGIKSTGVNGEENTAIIKLLHTMRSLPNGVKDRIYYSNGKWYDEKNVGQVILNGSEYWAINSVEAEAGTRFSLDAYDAKYYADNTSTDLPIWSNYFKGISTSEIDRQTYCIAIIRNNRFLLNHAEITTTNELKSWLSTHPTEVLYELQNPIVTEITNTTTIEALENIRTYTGLTTITSDILMTGSYIREIIE